MSTGDLPRQDNDRCAALLQRCSARLRLPRRRGSRLGGPRHPRSSPSRAPRTVSESGLRERLVALHIWRRASTVCAPARGMGHGDSAATARMVRARDPRGRDSPARSTLALARDDSTSTMRWQAPATGDRPSWCGNNCTLLAVSRQTPGSTSRMDSSPLDTNSYESSLPTRRAGAESRCSSCFSALNT
jgi:hypothetical protein